LELNGPRLIPVGGRYPAFTSAVVLASKFQKSIDSQLPEHAELEKSVDGPRHVMICSYWYMELDEETQWRRFAWPAAEAQIPVGDSKQ